MSGEVVNSGAGDRISDRPSPLLPDVYNIDRLFDSEHRYVPRSEYIRGCGDQGVDLAARQDSINWILKLLSVACLSLAAKMEETRVPLLLDLQMFDPRFVFEPKTVQRMELLVMANLNWKLLSVTPFDFLHYFSSKLHFNGFQHDPLTHVLSASSDLVLKTTRAIDFLSFLPSVIAAAAVISAAAEGADIPEMFYERVNKERVRSCHQLMVEYLVDTCHSVERRADPTPPVSPAGVLDAAACASCETRSSRAEPPKKKVRSSATDVQEEQP